MKFDSLGWLDLAQGYDISGNSFDRGGARATHLVVHGTAGGSDGSGTMAYMGANGVSTHFAISTDGTIWQGIPCSLAAWANAPLNAPRLNFACADLNPNLWTISVEFCKPDITNAVNITDAQKQSGFALIQFICETYGIPKKQGDGNGGIISHADINSIDRARCPGTFPWNDLVAFLQGGQPMTPNKYQIADAAAEWASTASFFPGGKSPSYTSGIAKAWMARVYAGSRLGPPVTGETDGTDWGGNAIKVQQFLRARCEWRVDGSSCRFFDGRGEIV
jgi:N-acetyl-anhydromuramyl-L-alanine amidase AmpD